MSVTFVLPKVDDDAIARGLLAISEALAKMRPKAQAHGVLGGEFGYGQQFENTVFEMFPFWWGECDCGAEKRRDDWFDAHPHAADCYRAKLAEIQRGLPYGQRDAAIAALCASLSLPYPEGSAVHCTCGASAQINAFDAGEGACDPRCSDARPNFAHKASGFEVRWYKYIGRSQELNKEITPEDWAAVVAECLESLK